MSKISLVSASNPKVIVDTMGGDHGPSVQVEGAIQAVKEFDAKCILVGDKSELQDLIKSFGAENLVSNSTFEIVHASQVIDMKDSPARAVRKKPDSSLCVSYNLLMEGRGSAVLSSGNSGAMMAAGRMICGLIPGIDRPAIATLIPTVGHSFPNVVIDSGANVECLANNLVQFAVMGSIYHSALFGSDSPLNHKPKIALLSNGTEASKGTDMIRSASMMLSKMEVLNYIGYVEGRDVARSIAEVIVCDGFVGNVLLKVMEGSVSMIYDQIKLEASSRPLAKLGLMIAKPILRAVFKEKLDYSAYGGAPLLGLKELGIVLHGSSGSRAVKNAIKFSRSFVESQMIEKIKTALSQLEAQLVDLDATFDSDVLTHADVLSANESGRDSIREEKISNK